jgi:hypothetical protein
MNEEKKSGPMIVTGTKERILKSFGYTVEPHEEGFRAHDGEDYSVTAPTREEATDEAYSYLLNEVDPTLYTFAMKELTDSGGAMSEEQKKALGDLGQALLRATLCGLLDEIQGDCKSPDSINDVCDAVGHSSRSNGVKLHT